MRRYIVRKGGVVELHAGPLLEFAAWFERTDETPFQDGGRRVARAELKNPDVLISTIFLGWDHSFGRGGDPVLFETMVFGREDMEDYQRRYTTVEEARAGHAQAVRFACGEIPIPTDEE